jgi:thiamine-phosphate pyrophosphorylase
MAFRFPTPLYAIADLTSHPSPVALVEALMAAGIRFVQLRAKGVSSGRFVALAREVKGVTDDHDATLIINDRADIARLIGAAGVHLGQDDLPGEPARALLAPGQILGLSTHTLDQLRAAAALGVADYLAFGPVFATRSKIDHDPPQGLAGLRAARRLTSLPLVAIGGVSAATLRDVLATGVDAVAMIGAIATAADPGAAARALQTQAVQLTAGRNRRRS